MNRAYTATGLSLIRSRPQTSLYYLAVHSPKIIAEGALCAVPTAYPGNSLSMTGTLNGLGYNLTNIKRGMTLWVGSEGARYDTGALRVRKDYVGSSLIEVMEYGSGLVNFGSATSLTVVEDYRIWPIHPSYDSGASRWRVDLDPYTVQTKSYGPQVIMGPPAVGIMDGGVMLASYVGDLSLQHSGSITSQTWTFPDGQTVTSALGSSKNPIVITYVNTSPLGGITTLKVTDSNGNSHIGQRLTFCFGTSGRWQPMDCKFDQITGGYKSGGYRTRVSIGEIATSVVVPDGAKVIIFEQASYGTAGSSVGGNYFGRDNVVLVGRVVTESQQINPFTDQLTFEIETEDGELRRSQSYDMFLESGSAASDWSMASGLTLDRAGLTLAKYRSTIANVVDFHPASGIAATNEIPYRDLAQGTLYDQMAYNYQAAGFGMIAFDMQGNLWAQLDTQVTGTSSTLATIMDIGYQDRRDQVQIDHEHRDTNAQYLIYAIQGGNYNPLAAWSPGDRSGYFGQRQEISRNLLAPDQDTLITWTGNKRAQDNNPYKSVRIPLVGNNRIDPVPQSLVTMSLSAIDDPRGFTWTNRNLIPYEVTVTYNPDHRSVSTELVAETVVNGIGGSAFTYPTVTTAPPAPPPNPVPPPPPGVQPGDGNTVFAYASGAVSKVVRTRNFLAASPTWEDITGTITGLGANYAVRLDPWDPANKGLVFTANGLYYSTNIRDASPTWTLCFPATSIPDKTAGGVQFTGNSQLWMSIHGNGRAYMMVGGPISSNPAVYVGRTENYTLGPDSWTFTLVGNAVASAAYAARIHIAQNGDDLVLVSFRHNGFMSLYSSTDHAATFSEKNFSGELYDSQDSVIFCSYLNNNNTIYLLNGTPTGAIRAMRTTTGPSGTWSDISPTGTAVSFVIPECVTESPSSDGNNLYWCVCDAATGLTTGLYKFSSGAWDPIQPLTSGLRYSGSGFGGWPWNTTSLQAGDATPIPAGRVMRTEDGGLSWIDATGNLPSLVIGAGYVSSIVPIWVAF